jgi:hypothetical protein
MTHHARELLIRLIWLALWMLAMLAATMLWYGHTADAPEETSVFKPARKIAQLNVMAIALQNAQSVDAPAVRQKSPPIACDARGMAILKIRVMASFALSSGQVDQLIERMHDRIGFTQRCAEWVDNMQTLAKFQSVSAPASQPSTGAQPFDEALSERVSWTRHLPCLFYNNGQKLGLAAGNPVHCFREQLVFNTPPHDANNGMQQAIGLSKSLLANAHAAAFSSLNQRDLLLTLDDKIQPVLDGMNRCLSQPDTCAYSARLPALKHVSAVIMDANSGDILATLCWSGPCDKLKAMGPLGALLIETPPASTAKLLHAMVLAQGGTVDGLMLQRQIKTSGQTDALVSKRNEWWEKQAICDARPGACQHPRLVKAMSEQLGWSTDCRPTDIQCGRMGLLRETDSMIFPGFIGRLKITNPLTTTSTMMDWKDYDQIRQGKKKSPTSVSYFNTALAVQSAIGAGDSRTSALGLAHLSGQILRMAQGQPAQQPALIRPMAGAPAGSEPSAAQRSAAQTVMGGMRKVLEPAETGWNGAGTVSGAFQREFKRACSDDCGIWAKTGTVSQQDRGFAGATLFTGIIDIPQLQQWRYQHDNKTAGRRIAIGVVVHPKAPGHSVHLASEMAMQLASELSLQGASQ